MPSDADHTPQPLNIRNYEDRRCHKRFHVARPGKLFRRSTQQYAAVVTRNLSFGGALLAVEAERAFTIGELIDLGITFGRHQVVPANKLMQGVVTRVERLEPGRQNVAVRYIQPMVLAEAA